MQDGISKQFRAPDDANEGQNLPKIWRGVLDRLAEEVPEATFKMWFVSARLRSLTLRGRERSTARNNEGGEHRGRPEGGAANRLAEAVAVIEAPNEFAVAWLQGLFATRIGRALATVTGTGEHTSWIVSVVPRTDGVRTPATGAGKTVSLQWSPVLSRRPINALTGLIRDPRGSLDTSTSTSTSTDASEGENRAARMSADQDVYPAAYKSPKQEVPPLGAAQRPVYSNTQGDSAVEPAESLSMLADSNLFLPLNAKFRLERFVQGRGTQVALYAAQALADEDGRESSFLAIFGGAQTGKTHILQGIGLRAQTRWKASVGYIQGSRFGERLTNSLIRQIVSQVDVLLIDDLHELARRKHEPEATTLIESVRRLTEAMLAARKRVAVSYALDRQALRRSHERENAGTGHVSPALESATGRLDADQEQQNWQSRFGGILTGALQLEISGADEGLRTAVASQRARELGIKLTESAITSLAHSDRTLGGIVDRVERYARQVLSGTATATTTAASTTMTLRPASRPPSPTSLLNAPDTDHNEHSQRRHTRVNRARAHLLNLMGSVGSDVQFGAGGGAARPDEAGKSKSVTWRCARGHKTEAYRATLDMVASTVAAYYDLSLGEIRELCRSHAVLVPRQVAMYLMREYNGLYPSYAELAQFFGKRDHTTVLHSVRKIAELLEAGDNALSEEVGDLQDILYGR